jgi:phage-related protein
VEGMSSLNLSIMILARDLASPVIRTVQSSLAALGAVGIAAGVAGVALGAIGVIAGKTATDFDQVMHKIAALTDTTAEQMEYYKQKILELGPALDMSSTDMGKALYFIISAGFKTKDAIEVLTYSAKAATAGMADQAHVADALTSILKSYEGENISVGHAVDDLTKMVVNGKVEFDTISRGIGFTAIQAHAAGLTIDEMSAAVSRLTQVSGESGARRIRMEFDNLTRGIGIDVDGVAKRATDLGLSFDKGKFAAMAFMDKLQYLATITGGLKGEYNEATVAQWMQTSATMDDTQAQEYLAEQFAHGNSMLKHLVGGAAAFIPAMVLLTNHGKAYTEILKQMGTEGEMTNKAFDIMRQSTAQMGKMFEMTMNSLMVTLGLKILPYVNMFLTYLIQIGRDAIAWLQQAENVTTLKFALIGLAVVITTILAPAIGTLLLTIAPFLLTFTAVIVAGILVGKAIQEVSTHMDRFKGVMQALSPIVEFVRMVINRSGEAIREALANPAIIAALQQLKTAFMQALPIIIPFAAIIGGVLFGALVLVLGAIGGLASALPSIIKVFTDIYSILEGVVRFVKDIFTGNWGDILPALKQIAWNILKIFLDMFLAIAHFAGGFIDVIAHIFGSSGPALAAHFGRAWDHLKSDVHMKLNEIGGAIGSFFSGIGTWFHNAGSAIGSAVGSVFSGIGFVVMSVIEFIVGLVATGLEVISQLPVIHQIILVFEWMTGQIVSTVQKMIWLLQFIFDQGMKAIGFVVSIAMGLIHQYIIDPIQNAWNSVSGAFVNFGTWVAAWFITQVISFGNWLKNIGKSISDGAGSVVDIVKKNVVDPVTNAFMNLVNGALGWGAKMISNFIDGIKSKWNDFTDMLGKIKDKGNDVLNGNSPPPSWPEQGLFGPTLIRNLSQGILASLPMLDASLAQVQAYINPQFLSPVGSSGVSMPMPVMSTGNNSTTMHVTANFPNATNREEIKAAMLDLQRQQYKDAQQPGFGQGFLK